MLPPKLEALGVRPLRAPNDGFQVAIAPEGRIVGIAAQGKGTMTTVVRALVDHAFTEWNLHRIEIHCAPTNHRSRAIPERLGFREEATLREAELVGGRWLDAVIYGLLDEEWGERRSPPKLE